MRQGEGRHLFRFYRDLIRLRRRHHSLATPNIEIVCAHNADRLLAFRRWKGPEQYLVVATLSDTGWPDGYALPFERAGSDRWREIFSSDAEAYAGDGVSNELELEGKDDQLRVKVPARGFVVLRRTPQNG
jgi:1,4-alpha-glucan branching enzyme